MAETLTLEDALARLQEVAPDAPFLALGQTVLWDEPMKGGIALASRRLGYARKLVAGVHDTDYFAKLPSGPRRAGRFKAVPHNDTTTRGLWSAAGEFSALFGSETVVTRDILQTACLRIDKIIRDRPKLLDEATEAWGWRGIVSLDEQPPLSGEVQLKGLFKELYETLDWAINSTLDCIAGADKDKALELAEDLRVMVCQVGSEDGTRTLGEMYRRLLQGVYDFCANHTIELEATQTTELLRFNKATAGLARFRLLDIFLSEPEKAVAAYDAALVSSEIYTLDRFGTGAIPFDLVVPGNGRGTIRIGPRGVVVNTPTPISFSTKSRVSSAMELAELVERKLGPDCALVGKAVTLIGMLAAEFVFVFHEGASGYVKYSRKLHDGLGPLAPNLNPILRVRYSPWDELQTCCAWLQLPQPLRDAFGADDICSPSLASRWRQVAEEQDAVLAKLGELRRPIDLIRFLDSRLGGSWNALAKEYEDLHDELEKVKSRIEKVRLKRIALYDELRAARRARVAAEREKGEHFRRRIFEKEASEQDVIERERLTQVAGAASAALVKARAEIRALMARQQEIAKDPAALRIHDRRKAIEVEAELKRLGLIRTAVIAGTGLRKAGKRPSAWWFPLLCPDGLWFRATVEGAECWLEPLQA